MLIPIRHITPLLRNSFFVLSALTLTGMNSFAQCPSQWTHIPVTSPPPFGSPVTVCENWDPDGAGPAPSELVVGGFFFDVAGTSASSVARLDSNTQTWSAIGPGLPQELVSAMAGAPNGDLVVAAGRLPSVGVVQVWNGASWTALPAFNGLVGALAVLPNGDIVAGGSFTTAGGVSVNGIARWDGVSWNPLGAGAPGGGSSNLVVLPNGNLISSSDGLYSWNGSAWTPIAVGTSVLVGTILDFQFLQNGGIVASGLFFTPGTGSLDGVAVWDGIDWTPTGFDPNTGIALAVTELPNGDIAAAGFFTTAGGTNANNVARWDGSSWNPIGLGLTGPTQTEQVFSLTTTPAGILYAGGFFSDSAGLSITSLAGTDANCPPSASCGYTAYGMGASPANTIQLAGSGAGQIGASAVFNATLVPSTATIFFASLSQANLPIFNGVALVGLNQVLLSTLAPAAGGNASWSIPVPASGALVGLNVFVQAAALDTAQPGGWALSNGVELDICP